MQPRTRLILIATATFFAGLLTGAAVFSDMPRSEAPPPEPAAPPAPEQSPPDAAAVSIPETAPEPGPAPPVQPEPPSVTLDVTDALQARVDELAAGWGRMQAELAQLRHRVALIEQREPQPDDESAPGGRRSGPATPAEQRDALLRAGVLPDVAEEILWRDSQLSLARLELYDEASRNGWLRSDRYRDELRRINEQRVSIEDEIGIDAYDRYLYETGQPNRVAVESVLPGSAGEESGLLPGDVIQRYGDVKVLDFQDLRAATSAGERDELVSVIVVRGGEPVELLLPRGPIGIGLEATRAEPDG
jgi:hypothetical protein